jgi:sporulation protein YlmC with PRC-barrel domain
MDIPINVDVKCTDGTAGHTAAIIMDPATRQVTYVVVKGKGSIMGEFLVPMDVIKESSPQSIVLRWSRDELSAAPRFDKAVFVGGAGGAANSPMVWPYASVDDMTFGAPMPAAFVQVEEVPGAGVAVHVGAHVEATDGRVGKVDEFLVDRRSSEITHVVLHQGHLWGKRSIGVPVSAIDHIADDIVYLKLDKAALEELPELPKQQPILRESD